MSIRGRNSGAVLLFCLLAGCGASINVRRFASAASRPPVPADSVRLFFSPGYVTGQYEPIAFLGTDADWNRPYNASVYKSLRARAGRLGANAVIIGSTFDANGNPRFAGMAEGGRNRSGAMAVAAFVPPSSPR